jgi:hypothetical protein
MLGKAKYGLTGKEFDRRCGAIAKNAVDATLLSLKRGVDTNPSLDEDYRKMEMIKDILLSLNVGEVAESVPGSLVSSTQAAGRPELDRIEDTLEAALMMVDDIASDFREQPVPVLKLPKEAK